MRDLKHQAPNPKEAPNFKLQKCGIGVSLVLGFWILVFIE
jgi:hypothetical protein